MQCSDVTVTRELGRSAEHHRAKDPPQELTTWKKKILLTQTGTHDAELLVRSGISQAANPSES